MAITTSTRRNQQEPESKPNPDKEAKIREFYSAPAREELEGLLPKPEKKKRVKNPNKTEFLQSMDNDLLEQIQASAKKKRLTRQAWIIQACLFYLDNDV